MRTITLSMPGSAMEADDHYEKLLSLLYPAELLPLKKAESENAGLCSSAIIIMNERTAVGHCRIYLNQNMRLHEQKVACLGRFECINDQATASELLHTARKVAFQLGCQCVIGPMNGSTWHTHRIASATDFPVFLSETVYPGWYQKLWTDNGFHKLTRYISSVDDGTSTKNERTKKVERRFSEAGITYRRLNMPEYEQELEKLYEFCIRAFAGNFLFTPIEKELFVQMYLPLKKYVDPQFVTIAEDAHGIIRGFCFCLINRNDKNKKGLIIKTLARDPSSRYAGMGLVLLNMVKNKTISCGFDYVIHAFMEESNVSRALSGQFEGRPVREYFLYESKTAS